MKKNIFAIFLSVGLLCLGAVAQAQSFGDILGRTIEHAATSEVQRKVDRETRRATRCAMGDEECVDNAQAQQSVQASAAGSSGTNAASSVDPGGDHPLITPYQGSVRIKRDYDAYNEYLRIIGNRNGKNQTETLEGKLTRIRYNNPRGRSAFEIERNYRNALTGRGLKIDYECSRRDICGNNRNPNWYSLNGINLGIDPDVRYFTGKMAYGNGEAYVAIAVNTNVTYVHVLETANMDKNMVGVDATSLAAGLDKDGKVTLDGIYFDTGKDSLRPESDAALQQVGLLLHDRPDLHLQIVGHTDNQGGMALNQSLSERRANRVREAIISRYGIDGARLTAVGKGASQPVASNDTEEGRAKNRRVELVRQ